ncbi:hypothetical protein DEO72_LG9g1456 [Vigna unguiculata]|uniref:Uncharacterized protein n=1 Tax=Vigna unguiculata TaxID=3917 RepID=A0A4D6N0M9_VIGUN|nr:hypothetical protein DEO72_LG9g1456 [Vigna unguiculata]
MFYGGVRQQHTAVQDSGDSNEVSDKEEKSRIVDDRFTFLGIAILLPKRSTWKVIQWLSQYFVRKEDLYENFHKEKYAQLFSLRSNNNKAPSFKLQVDFLYFSV